MRRLLPLAALLAVAAPSLARAEGAIDADLRTFRPSTDKSGSLATEGLSTPGAWNLQLQHWLSLESASLKLDQGAAGVARVVGPRLLGEPTVALGLGARAAVGAALPYVLHQDGAASPLTDGRPLPAQGIGDLTLTGKALVREADPDRFSPGFALVTRVQLPTGDRASTISDRATVAELRGLVGLDLLHFLQVGGALGYRTRFAQHPIADVTIGDAIPWGLTVSLKPRVFGIDRAGKWRIAAEARGDLGAVPNALFATTRVSPTFVGASARYELSPSFSLFAGVEASLTPAIGAPAVRGVFGLTYAPMVVDDDHDGVPDERDECPGLPEDGKGASPRDGCPDYEGEATTAPEPPAPPALEEPPLPPPAAAPTDTDGDGIPDDADKCPDQPETKNAYEDDDGCPELDRDHDTFLDPVDHCPDQAETFDGVADDDGCPEPLPTKGKAPQPLLVEAKGALLLSGPIAFVVHAPSKESTGALRAIAAWALAHPTSRVRIAVKPEGKGEEAARVATTRAVSLVESIVAFAHAGGLAEAVVWDPKSASKSNVSLVVVPAPGAEPPAAPGPKQP